MDNTERELWEQKSTRCSKCACTCNSTKRNSELAPDHATSSEVQYVSDDTSGGESITPEAIDNGIILHSKITTALPTTKECNDEASTPFITLSNRRLRVKSDETKF